MTAQQTLELRGPDPGAAVFGNARFLWKPDRTG